jgi:hypothetical protein
MTATNFYVSAWTCSITGLIIVATQLNSDNSMQFAVRNERGECLDTDGDMVVERHPSECTPEYLKYHRFNTFYEAQTAAIRYVDIVSEGTVVAFSGGES